MRNRFEENRGAAHRFVIGPAEVSTSFEVTPAVDDRNVGFTNRLLETSLIWNDDAGGP